MADENIFFMKVDNPVEVRRNLLESSRNAIHSLQRYERFKKIREKKAEQIIALRRAVKEMNQLFLQLKKELPDTELHTVEKVPHHRSKKKQEKKQKQLPIASSELTKLEQELKKIEAKLDALT